MSFDNQLHAVLRVAFVTLVSTAFVTTAIDEVAHAAAVAKAKTTQVAATTAALRASR